MALKPAFLIATLLWASAVAAHSKIYTYVDADGQRHYTDVPDNNRYRLLALSPNDRTASGDRYDSALLAKAFHSAQTHLCSPSHWMDSQGSSLRTSLLDERGTRDRFHSARKLAPWARTSGGFPRRECWRPRRSR